MKRRSIFDEIALKDVISFVVDNRGKTVPVEDSGIPLIATANISNSELYPSVDTDRYVSEEIYSNWFRSHPQVDDVILTNKGSKNGEVCLVPYPVEFCIAQDMVALRANKKIIYPKYLLASLRSSLVQKRIKLLNVDAVIPHFKKSDFDKLFIPLPSLDVQEFIGQIYFDISLRIELNRKNNETLEGIAKAIFKSWFIDFDPVRAKSEGRSTGLPDEISKSFSDSFEDSELGEIPYGWKSGILGDYVSIKRGGSPRPIKDFMVEEGLPWVKISDATASDNRFIPFTKGFIRPEGLSKTVFLKRGSLILSNSATPGIPKFLDLDACIHDGWLYFPEKTIFSDLYLYELFLWIRPSLCLLGNGSVFTNLKTDILKNFEVLIPNNDCLKLFDKILDPLHQKCLLLMRHSQSLCEIRDTLLPKLISGELKVPDAEKMLEEVGI